MIPSVLKIAVQSLRLGVYAKQHKFKKYDENFHRILINRDPHKGLTITEEEAYTLYSSVKAVANIEGVIAEFGVYKGASARIICETKGATPFYLFDTFEGMPNQKISENDRWRQDTHQDTDLKSVRNYLKVFENIIFVSGAFPESLLMDPNLENVVYSFVHLDVDLYESTLSGLNYFYPRLSKGGRLVSHNYNLKQMDGGDTPGVKQAFDEYFSDRRYMVTEIAETQCLIIKSG